MGKSEKHIKLKVKVNISNQKELEAMNNFLKVVGLGEGSVNEMTVIDAQEVKTERKEPKSKEIEQVQNTVSEENKAVEEVTENKTVEEAPVNVTIDEIRSLTAEKAKLNRERVKEILDELGANNVSALDPSLYGKYHSKLKEIE
jgi:phenylalanyl-tRNA synthetase alpha subunit